MVETFTHHVKTSGQGDAHDVTSAVSAAVAESGVSSGIATIFVVGSTAAVTTIEFEPGAVADLPFLSPEGRRKIMGETALGVFRFTEKTLALKKAV